MNQFLIQLDTLLDTLALEAMEIGKIYVGNLPAISGLTFGYSNDENGELSLVICIDDMDGGLTPFEVANLSFRNLTEGTVLRNGVTKVILGISLIRLPLHYREAFRWISLSVTDSYVRTQNLRDVYEILRSYIAIFRRSRITDLSQLLGYWGEFLTIATGADIDTLVDAWRINAGDAEDFWIAGSGSIEVKVNSSSRREHFFSSNQIRLHSEECKIVVSFLTHETDTGKCIPDLLEEIRVRTKNSTSFVRFMERVQSEIGFMHQYANGPAWDHEMAMRSRMFFSENAIPRLEVVYPILFARWQADLSTISPNLSKGETLLAELIGS